MAKKYITNNYFLPLILTRFFRGKPEVFDFGVKSCFSLGFGEGSGDIGQR
jgi:hypothetical protein